MAPKRRRVVKTTKKVVQETVQVSVIDNGTNDAINTQSQSLPLDLEGETEELQEGLGIGTEEALDLVRGKPTTPPSSTTTRRMSTRRTIVFEDKPHDVKLRVPVEEPGPKESVEVRTEGGIKEKPEEPNKETAQVVEEDRGSDKYSEDLTEGGEVTHPESEETEGEEARPEVESQPRPEVEPEARKAEKAVEVEQKKTSLKDRSKRRKRKRAEEGNEEYRRYVFKVLKQVHPGMKISGMAMTVLNGYMNDMFERLAEEAARLSKYTGRLTLSSREIQGAVRLILPGELGRHAIAEGAKAVSNYMAYDAP